MRDACSTLRVQSCLRLTFAMTEFVHTFAGNPLDRGEAERRSEAWLEQAEASPDARFLLLSGLQPLVVERGEESGLVWLSADEIPQHPELPPPVYLGKRGDQLLFARDVSVLGDAKSVLAAESKRSFEDARVAAMHLPGDEAGIVAQARAQTGWHKSHAYCSVCGAPTEQRRGGQVRRCGACAADHFPRTDPVVIMLITDGERCLLGQSGKRLVTSKMYSALAGFVDQGESIEEAVRREVREEAGLEVGEVRYHSSQPWPFPSSLMIGCHGKASTTQINFDDVEMTDVRWFSRAEAKAALAGDVEQLRLPGPLAIAHHLIRAWVDGEVD